ncbi:hypothetical protein [Actinomycetospora lemnae]|uniref:Uncharacterized protein n=1 Tax=Actinomycetospora lemnae TaxID=3019891 RepID=A0ABT5SX34_9PSEU|nr:hypothetical protein [Actinomycetospora sp. DW7H6]MDD7966557.1 hypothetical protein [Actinomycetospora sp. DW7H6]
MDDEDAASGERATLVDRARPLAPPAVRLLPASGLSALSAGAVLVADVFAVGPVLDVVSAVAVVSAAPEVGVEALDGLGPHSTDCGAPDGRPYVLLDLAHVADSSLAVDVDDLEPPVKEVVHRSLGARAAALVDLVEQPRPDFSASRSVSRRVARAGTVSRNQSFSPVTWSSPA